MNLREKMENRKAEAGTARPANGRANSAGNSRFPVSHFRFPVFHSLCLERGRHSIWSRIPILLCVGVLVLSACSRQSLEDRARKQTEKILGSMGDAENRALAQKVTPEQVKQAQEALTRVHEYMGEVNGQLDAVTVNAVEAFQRSHGLKDNGILNEKTQRLLQEQLAAK
jgi:hypothetical protein